MVNEDLGVRQALATEYTAWPLQLLASGDKFEAGELFTGVANGDTKRLVIENNQTDRALLTLEPTVKSSGQVFVRRRENPSVDTAGDSATVINPKTDASAPGDVSVTTAGDGETGVISGGTQYPEITAGGGSNVANAAPGESGTTGVTDIIMPGDSLSLSASNESGSVQDISIVVAMLDVPTAEFDDLRY